jgi:hypothetical protein
MSVVEIIEELPRLSREDQMEVHRHLKGILEGPSQETRPGPAVGLEWMDGRLVMRTNRIITQAEIEEMLADFP